MGSNQIGDLYRGFSRNQEGMGFGYTVAVTVDPITSNARRSAGAFGWGGAFGTRSWTDPEEELTAVLMLQQPRWQQATRPIMENCHHRETKFSQPFFKNSSDSDLRPVL